VNFFNQHLQAVDHWVGVRAVSLDHLPLVGWLPKEELFLQQYKTWVHHAHWVMTEKMPNRNCLAFTGFGSRGLVTIPLLAKVLQSLILDGPPVISNALTQAIAPARFLKKQMSKGCYGQS
jgi:tRNA 5-methylaminomethyl-2-thiouridine biosynthesis bifunctional protein